jgi:hypothetical protein
MESFADAAFVHSDPHRGWRLPLGLRTVAVSQVAVRIRSPESPSGFQILNPW